MNVFILGAGASKGYDGSKTGQRMPLATDFFKTYNSLKISEKLYVLVGDIINYLRDTRGMHPFDFVSYNADIEEIHSEINDKLMDILQKDPQSNESFEERYSLWRANYQLVFLFNAVINEIQNGASSMIHKSFVKLLHEDDYVLTFNWDTLLDRALRENTTWSVDDGYGIIPKGIYRNSWMRPLQESDKKPSPKLIKLHGSTNWLTSYATSDEAGVRLSWDSPSDVVYIYEGTIDPYSTYSGRFIKGYEDFSYGYYPPNLPEKSIEREGYVRISARPNHDEFEEMYPEFIKSSDDGLVSMPLIIPPIKKKEYNMFGKLFESLWDSAKQALIKADVIYVIGYSFPMTDYKSKELFCTAFLERNTMPRVVIVNPYPESIEQLFRFEFGIDDKHLDVRKDYFSINFKL